MLIFLCRLEWRALTRDTRSIAAIMLLIICTAYGVYTGESWRQERERSITTVTTARMQSRDKQRAQLAGPQQASSILSQRPPVFAYFVEDEAVLPPMPLAGLSIGPGDALPHVARLAVYANRYELFDEAAGTQNAVMLASGRFDLAFVLIWLVPLILIGCTYDLLSDDRESGVLALALAQPISLRVLLCARTFVRGGTLLGTAALLSIGGLIIGNGPVTPRVLILLLVFGSVLVAYGLFWLLTAALVNCLRWAPASNALALGSLWIALLLIVPGTMDVILNRAVPPPSRPEMVSGFREVYERVKQNAEHITADFYAAHPEYNRSSASSIDRATQDYWAVQQRAGDQMASILNRFDQQSMTRHALAGRLQFASPAIAMQHTLDQLSGNNGHRFRRFGAQVQTFFDQLQTHLVPPLFENRPLTLREYDGLPRFHFQEEPLGDQVGRVVVPAIVLGLLDALLAIFAWRACERH